ncbi:MAG: hypothetical protein CMH58_08460 [Myxococcales bacterium]|nr:hypothetical protein [Myxococcales bacterium]
MAIEVRFGRYQLLHRIAQGGMAEVYLAQQTGPAGFSKRLVIKKIHPHLAHNEEFVGMFLDEARVAAQLNHPNIAQIYELGEDEGQYYIAMEFIDGWNLRQLNKKLRRMGMRIPPELGARIAAETCAGLDYAHRFKDPSGRNLRIVHRDISPQNIMISRDGVVKVIDFGIAKAATNQQLTQGNVLKGKFSYMSPEQAAGKKLDRRSDIFSLGVVLFEMLMGEKPFRVPGPVGKRRSDNTELLRRITRCDFRLPEPGEVPDLLREVIRQTITLHRQDRLQTARAMRDMLEDAVERMPGPGSARQLARFIAQAMGDQPLEGVQVSASFPSLEPSQSKDTADPQATQIVSARRVSGGSKGHPLDAPTQVLAGDRDIPTRIRVSNRPEPSFIDATLPHSTAQGIGVAPVVITMVAGSLLGLLLAYLTL